MHEEDRPLRRPLSAAVRLLIAMAALAAIVALGFAAYNLYAYFWVQGKAEDLLAEPQPKAEQLRAAFEVLRHPHPLADYDLPAQTRPANDPVIGKRSDAQLGDLTSWRAQSSLTAVAFEGVAAPQLAADLLRPADEAARARAAHARQANPSFARAVALRETFAAGPLAPNDAAFCGDYPPCVLWYVQDLHPGLYAFLRVRQDALAGRDYHPQRLEALRAYPALGLRLFADLKAGAESLPPTDGDAVLLRDVLRLQAAGVHQGFLWSAYLALAALGLAGIAVLLYRLRRQGDPPEPHSAEPQH